MFINVRTEKPPSKGQFVVIKKDRSESNSYWSDDVKNYLEVGFIVEDNVLGLTKFVKVIPIIWVASERTQWSLHRKFLKKKKTAKTFLYHISRLQKTKPTLSAFKENGADISMEMYVNRINSNINQFSAMLRMDIPIITQYG